MSKAPTSYRGPSVGDQPHERTFSQTSNSNLADTSHHLAVGEVLEEKGRAVRTLAPDALIRDAVAQLREFGIGVLVITDGDAVRGILSERDIVRRLDTEGAGVLDGKVSDLMTADPICCTEDDVLLDIMHRMTQGHFRHMPVVDNGSLVGLISIGDVVKHRLRELEYETLRMKQMIVG